MKTMLTQEILEKHKKWLDDEDGGERANLRGANLRDADLRGANLRGANFWDADLRGANLRGANFWDADLRGANFWDADLRGANLRDANLRDADLRDADLRDADLSNCQGLLSSIDYLQKNFKKIKEGYICYKTFNSNYDKPDYWKVKEGSIISEVVNPCRTVDCACGVNVGTLKWVKENTNESEIWKCLIEWEWLAGVVVPYHTDGKIRCEKVRLLEVI